MKTQIQILVAFIVVLFASACSSENPLTETPATPIITGPLPNPEPQTPSQIKEIHYLALGDSYTIGQNVCETCRFPEQLKRDLESFDKNIRISLKIIAQTGWTTTNLISAINNQNPTSNYDLVTLLIGVNNQYQYKPFSLYEKEFPELVRKAIALAKGDKSNLIVVSIPDYAYTPFGQQSENPSKISLEIDQYNAYAKKYCEDNTIQFINITDITRQGLNNTNLVAQDGLHPSAYTYSLFVKRILSPATAVIHN
ncbi:GDSL-like Lipase/Acylhydrolase [compost metagenome]